MEYQFLGAFQDQDQPPSSAGQPSGSRTPDNPVGNRQQSSAGNGPAPEPSSAPATALTASKKPGQHAIRHDVPATIMLANPALTRIKTSIAALPK
jgi:hypothetical protein